MDEGTLSFRFETTETDGNVAITLTVDRLPIATGTVSACVLAALAERGCPREDVLLDLRGGLQEALARPEDFLDVVLLDPDRCAARYLRRVGREVVLGYVHYNLRNGSCGPDLVPSDVREELQGRVHELLGAEPQVDCPPARRPLVVLHTDALMELFLGGRERSRVGPLVRLRAGVAERVVPEYARAAFRLRAAQWVATERARLVPPSAALTGASIVGAAARDLERATARTLAAFDLNLDRGSVLSADTWAWSGAVVRPHGTEAHVRGELRHLRGEPPADGLDGLHDGRFYEALLELAEADFPRKRPKLLVTLGDRFDDLGVVSELRTLGFIVHKLPVALHAELLAWARDGSVWPWPGEERVRRALGGP